MVFAFLINVYNDILNELSSSSLLLTKSMRFFSFHYFLSVNLEVASYSSYSSTFNKMLISKFLSLSFPSSPILTIKISIETTGENNQTSYRPY